MIAGIAVIARHRRHREGAPAAQDQDVKFSNYQFWKFGDFGYRPWAHV
jgi:hypothetical protein